MKPTVVHVIDQFNRGGTELGILTLIKRGFYHDVDLHVIGLARGHESIYQEFRRHLGPDHVTCLMPQKQFACSSPSTFLTGSLAASKFLTGTLTASKFLADSLSATFLLAREFQRIQPQTAILSLAMANQAGRLAAWFNPTLKIISFEHFTHYNPFLSWFSRQTSQRVDAVFADCPETARAAMELYKGKCASDIPTYSVPLTILEPNVSRSVHQPAVFKLLSVGRFDKAKNFSSLIRAVAELIERGHNLELTLVGEGSQHNELLKLITELKIADRVHMPGFLADSQKLQSLFNEADIYVQPSLHEGFCLAVAEALASGTPTVATDVGGIRGYGRHGENMIKLEGATQRDIMAGLEFLMNHYKEYAPQMTREALKTAKQQFGKAPVLAQWRQAKPSLIGRRQRSSARAALRRLPRFRAQQMHDAPPL